MLTNDLPLLRNNKTQYIETNAKESERRPS